MASGNLSEYFGAGVKGAWGAGGERTIRKGELEVDFEDEVTSW